MNQVNDTSPKKQNSEGLFAGFSHGQSLQMYGLIAGAGLIILVMATAASLTTAGDGTQVVFYAFLISLVLLSTFGLVIIINSIYLKKPVSYFLIPPQAETMSKMRLFLFSRLTLMGFLLASIFIVLTTGYIGII